MKRFKKPKTEKVTLTARDINAIKRDVTETAVGTASLLYMVAFKDEFGMGLEELKKVYVRATRYARYLDDHVVAMKNLADDLEKDTGIKIKWR